MHWPVGIAVAAGACLIAGLHHFAQAQEPWRVIFPEQRRLEIRDPSQFPKARLPAMPPPPTVTDQKLDSPRWELTLDEAIRTGLDNMQVVRVLAGATAISSGQTIYDPAIANTQIDQARGRFDPTVQSQNNFSRIEQPQAAFVPAPPAVQIQGVTTDDFLSSTGISKNTVTGGAASLNVNVNPTRFRADGFPLNPQTGSSTSFVLTQPLLQGAGARVNLAPIVIARLNTERSFFQFKESVQESVRGVIDAYWGLLFARTDVWARRQQVEQGRQAFERAQGRLSSGFGNAAEVAQARSSLQNFKANLIASEANLLQQEAVLRNLLGLPPSDLRRIVPVTPPTTDRLKTEWEAILDLAEERRPDLIELKLILEADDQQLIVARNTALPRLDVTALYRWNGLEGVTPVGQQIASGPGQFTDWQLGVNFAVPLGLRQARASLRQQELLIMRDRSNLSQGLHGASHQLAASYRNVAQFYEQYLAYGEAKRAALTNLEQQKAIFRAGRGIYLNVLQAITDWGNAVSLESQALSRYNTELATLERQTGTILETHGVRFYEERYRSIGPLGRFFKDRCYPRDSRPSPNVDRYPPPDEAGPIEQLPPGEPGPSAAP